MGRVTSFHLSIWGFLVACFFLQGTRAYSCPPDWMTFQTHCYALRKTPMSWNDAEADCQSFGSRSHLASVLSEEEHKHLASAITGSNEIKHNIWIGLFRKKQGGRIKQWRWTDNSVTSYMPWGLGQPNNCYSDQYCVELYGLDLLDWNDSSCKNENYYICKMPL